MLKPLNHLKLTTGLPDDIRISGPTDLPSDLEAGHRSRRSSRGAASVGTIGMPQQQSPLIGEADGGTIKLATITNIGTIH